MQASGIEVDEAASRGGAIMVFENMFVFRETDVSGCINCPLDGHCEFVKCKEKEHERV